MSLETAPSLIASTVGSSTAAVLFGVALLLAGQASTIASTLAGQIVMEGFLNLRVAPWVRRLVTRGLAIVPAFIILSITGDVRLFVPFSGAMSYTDCYCSTCCVTPFSRFAILSSSLLVCLSLCLFPLVCLPLPRPVSSTC